MAQRAVKPRNPYAVELRRLGRKVKPSKKAYTRKGRSKDRPFAIPAPGGAAARGRKPFAGAGAVC
jgi:hypothetical protein